MTRFSHAVRDERNGIDGAVPGDQDKKEVRIQQYYAKNDAGVAWSWVIRARDPQLAERIAHNMELIAENDMIGYSQRHRMDMYYSAVKNGGDLSKAQGDCDCSSGVCAATTLAGGNITPKQSTSSMLAAFKASKQFEILTDAKYIQSSDYLRRGDILLRIGHTAVMVDNGSKAGSDGEVHVTETLPSGRTFPIEVDEYYVSEGKEYGVKQWCRVRSGPSTDDDILGKACQGERFDAYAFIEDWYQINYKGRTGYIYKDFVSEIEG